MKDFRRLGLLLLGLSAAGWAGAQTPAATAAPLPQTEVAKRLGFLPGYLQSTEMPDSLALLPPPPTAGSPAFLADEEAHRDALKNRTPERLALAVADANLRFPDAAKIFASILGVEPSEKGTPHLYVLLRRSLSDAGLASYAAKNHYNRVRPFAHYNESCFTPESEAALRKDGSYPSGHAAIGWAWALLLSELAPDRANALLKRGYDFGQSRMIGGVHWQSDVDAGRLVGASALARLHANAEFASEMAAAKAEIESARVSPAPAPK